MNNLEALKKSIAVFGAFNNDIYKYLQALKTKEWSIHFHSNFKMSISEVEKLNSNVMVLFVDDSTIEDVNNFIKQTSKNANFASISKILICENKSLINKIQLSDENTSTYILESGDLFASFINLLKLSLHVNQLNKQLQENESDLARHNINLSLALQSAQMGSWQFFVKSDKRIFDKQTCKLLGLDYSKFGGTSEEFFSIVHPEDRAKVKIALRKTLEDKIMYQPSYRVIWPDNTIHFIRARGQFNDLENGENKIEGIIWDITDQVLQEQQLSRTQKLESLSLLSGGIAHDFNNLLTSIFGYIDWAKEKCRAGECAGVVSNLDMAIDSYEKAKSLTKQLTTFSKGGETVIKQQPIENVLRNSVQFALSGSNVKAKFHFNENLTWAAFDEYQLSQVIENLVINAKQAMFNGGEIFVTCENVTNKSDLPPSLSLGKKDYVKIQVIDQGCGISEEIMTRIFDPFFTTKANGTGLGLSISYSIIKKQKGEIQVYSMPNMGTTVVVYIPASKQCDLPKDNEKEKNDSKEEIHLENGKSKFSKKVLILEDVPEISEIYTRNFISLGCDVVCAATGESALDQFTHAVAKNKPFDLAILDLTISGGKGGREIVGELLKISPKLIAVASSGHIDDPAMKTPKEFGFVKALPKPHLRQDLVKLMNEFFVD